MNLTKLKNFVKNEAEIYVDKKKRFSSRAWMIDLGSKSEIKLITWMAKIIYREVDLEKPGTYLEGIFDAAHHPDFDTTVPVKMQKTELKFKGEKRTRLHTYLIDTEGGIIEQYVFRKHAQEKHVNRKYVDGFLAIFGLEIFDPDVRFFSDVTDFPNSILGIKLPTGEKMILMPMEALDNEES